MWRTRDILWRTREQQDHVRITGRACASAYLKALPECRELIAAWCPTTGSLAGPRTQQPAASPVPSHSTRSHLAQRTAPFDGMLTAGWWHAAETCMQSFADRCRSALAQTCQARSLTRIPAALGCNAACPAQGQRDLHGLPPGRPGGHGAGLPLAAGQSLTDTTACRGDRVHRLPLQTL